MKKFLLELMGCDDSTEIEVVLTDDELDFLTYLQEKFNEVGGGCSPTLHIISRDEES